MGRDLIILAANLTYPQGSTSMIPKFHMTKDAEPTIFFVIICFSYDPFTKNLKLILALK